MNPGPTESSANLKFEIGYVLFLDIIGYSKLLIEEQKERLKQLTAIVLATDQVRESTDERVVRLLTGGRTGPVRSQALPNASAWGLLEQNRLPDRCSPERKSLSIPLPVNSQAAVQ